MKKGTFYILAILLVTLFSFNIAHAVMPAEDHKDDSHGKVDLMEQIKEKKQIVRNLKAENAKLEKQIKEKINNLQMLLAKQPKGNMVGKEQIQSQLVKKMKAHMMHMKQIQKTEKYISECLNKAHKHMAQKKPEACIKMLEKAIDALEKKHHMLVQLNKSLDDFIELLKSLDYK